MATTSADQDAYRRLAERADLPFVTLTGAQLPGVPRLDVSPLAVPMLSAAVAERFRMVPVSFERGIVTIAIADPFDGLARKVASTFIPHDKRFVVAPATDILDILDRVPQRDEERGAAPRIAPSGTVAPATTGYAAPAAAPAPVPPPAPAAAAPTPSYPRLGEILLARGDVTPEAVESTLSEQERTGVRLGEILVHGGALSEQALVVALATQFDMPLIDLQACEPDPIALQEIPEPVARRLRCVPLAIDDGTLYLATCDKLDDETTETLREHTSLRLRTFLAPQSEIDLFLQRIHGQAYVDSATYELLNRSPEDCANRVVTPAQRGFLATLAIVILIALVLLPIPTLVVLFALSSVFYLAVSVYKLKLMYAALGHEYELDVSDEELAAIDERQLPMYTILVPLYKEAAIVHHLVTGVDGLDYPKSKLDVRLLCEADDEETIEAIRELNLPPHFRLVIVPESQPKTKPKACNYGLLQAEGDIVVIYDAEDRPDPDQLKKVWAAFQKADPTVACIQAKLNYFNQDQNLLTRWFAIEYSMWFDLVLPGLASSDVPIPLGGTSNHFDRERLTELGAWDPFNVTEDADLGIRLHKAGYKTAIVDSTTLEEANSQVPNWVRQRSRWIKGYIQTWLVHMRNPARLLKEIGPKSFISFQLVIGGTFIFLLNPIFWVLTTLFLFTQADIIRQLFPSFVFYMAAILLFIGNFTFVYMNVAGAVQRGYYGLARFALLSPLYWGLMSLAAWKGFIQLFTNPFYWEKTEHGLEGSQAPGGARRPAPAPAATTTETAPVPVSTTTANTTTGD